MHKSERSVSWLTASHKTSRKHLLTFLCSGNSPRVRLLPRHALVQGLTRSHHWHFRAGWKTFLLSKEERHSTAELKDLNTAQLFWFTRGRLQKSKCYIRASQAADRNQSFPSLVFLHPQSFRKKKPKTHKPPKIDLCHHSQDHRRWVTSRARSASQSNVRVILFIYVVCNGMTSAQIPAQKRAAFVLFCVLQEAKPRKRSAAPRDWSVGCHCLHWLRSHFRSCLTVSNLYLLVHLAGRYPGEWFQSETEFNSQGMVENLLSKGGFMEQTSGLGEGGRTGLDLSSFTVFIGTPWNTKLAKICHCAVSFQSRHFKCNYASRPCVC